MKNFFQKNGIMMLAAVTVVAVWKEAGFFMIFYLAALQNIDNSTLEAARIDGAGELRILSQVVMPMSIPIIATLALLAGLAYWNDWYNGLLYLTNTKLFSLQNYLNRILLDIQFMTQSMAGSAEAANALGKMPTITVRMAIAVIGILPLMIIFPFFQSYFARGMTVGAVKG